MFPCHVLPRSQHVSRIAMCNKESCDETREISPLGVSIPIFWQVICDSETVDFTVTKLQNNSKSEDQAVVACVKIDAVSGHLHSSSNLEVGFLISRVWKSLEICMWSWQDFSVLHFYFNCALSPLIPILQNHIPLSSFRIKAERSPLPTSVHTSL